MIKCTHKKTKITRLTVSGTLSPSVAPVPAVPLQYFVKMFCFVFCFLFCFLVDSSNLLQILGLLSAKRRNILISKVSFKTKWISCISDSLFFIFLSSFWNKYQYHQHYVVFIQSLNSCTMLWLHLAIPIFPISGQWFCFWFQLIKSLCHRVLDVTDIHSVELHIASGHP